MTRTLLLACVMLLGGFMLTWKQLVAVQYPNSSNLQIGRYDPVIEEREQRQFFDDKKQAIEFIKEHEGNRKFWDFKLYELREVRQ